jgi:hypothetical protein
LNDQLTTIDSSSLTEILGDLVINNNQNLTTFYLSNLSTVGDDIKIDTNTSLLTLDISSITSVANLASIKSNSVLTTLTLGATGFSALDYDFSNNALSQTSVNNIFIALASSGATPTSIKIDGGSNAAPTDASLAARTTLLGAGWTFSTN